MSDGQYGSGESVDIPNGSGGVCSPTASPAPSTSMSPTLADCSGTSDVSLTIELFADFWPADISWQVTNACTNDIVDQVPTGTYGGQEFETITEVVCLEDGILYTFDIFDSYSDGICCGYGPGN